MVILYITRKMIGRDIGRIDVYGLVIIGKIGVIIEVNLRLTLVEADGGSFVCISHQNVFNFNFWFVQRVSGSHGLAFVVIISRVFYLVQLIPCLFVTFLLVPVDTHVSWFIVVPL